MLFRTSFRHSNYGCSQGSLAIAVGEKLGGIGLCFEQAREAFVEPGHILT